MKIYINVDEKHEFMSIKTAVEKLESHAEFLKWKEGHKDAYLSYAFTVLEDDKGIEWQIGFFNSASDKITAFTFKGDDIVICADEDAFKKEESKILELDMNKVKINVDNAINNAEEFQKKKYPNEVSTKAIVILQNLAKEGLVWNITYITKSFNTLNLKINAEDGKVVSDKLSSILDFQKK
jgi:hypothetical protein